MAENENLTFTVNGQKVSLAALPGETLADLLRNRLLLTGTKIGCNEAECGACTVLVDGEPILSCIYPAERAEGKTVVTIEGLARSVNGATKLHPLQEAFIEHGAVQCGFCIPGQIMTSYALLQQNPDPSRRISGSRSRIRSAAARAIRSIENAIQAAAHALRTGEPVPPSQTGRVRAVNTNSSGISRSARMPSRR